MSEMGHQRDISQCNRHVRFAPTADIERLARDVCLVPIGNIPPLISTSVGAGVSRRRDKTERVKPSRRRNAIVIGV